MILNRVVKDIQKEVDNGAEVAKVKLVMDDTDGYCEQYRCGTTLFLLWKLAKEQDIVYDCAVACAGYGKSKLDG